MTRNKQAESIGSLEVQAKLYPLHPKSILVIILNWWILNLTNPYLTNKYLNKNWKNKMNWNGQKLEVL